MCLMWVLLQFAVLALYWDIPSVIPGEGAIILGEFREDEPLVGPEETLERYGTVWDDQIETNLSSDITPQQELSEASTAPSLAPSNISNSFSVFRASQDLLREEVVVLLTAQFITLFNQTALETMVTPLTQRSFGFGELANSLMYSLCGVEVILGFILVRWISRRVEERAVLAVGLLVCSVACIWCLFFLADPRGGYSWELTAFVTGVFLQLLGLPFVAVSQVSLFSKVTAEKTQGFSQGVRRSVGGLATILGPLWAGGLTANLYLMLGVMLALLLMITVMMILSYDRLVEPKVVQRAQSSDNDE
ncbi:uncharacterized protein mfsd8l2 isoform X2 [Esox lucius]|uniref:uncharacterized protein mfsd8l2 isoform X2 n=1 Tax=Esox lucius TaxID=8010 RepID=UPI00147735B6|nr:uncharacterized protein mfsd8l2 isoform X2 [Esox lucius]